MQNNWQSYSLLSLLIGLLATSAPGCRPNREAEPLSGTIDSRMEAAAADPLAPTAEGEDDGLMTPGILELELGKPGVPSRLPGIEGVYVTPYEISGFSGTVLELKNGRYRYWFYTDVMLGKELNYPLTGDYAFSEDRLRLPHEQISQEVWTFTSIEGIPVLLRNDALEHWKSRKKNL